MAAHSPSGHLHKPFKTIGKFSLHYSGDIAIILMDSNENRLNYSSVTALNELLDEVEKNNKCKALITTGKGKFYGNGIDLEYVRNAPEDELHEYNKGVYRLFQRLLLFPIPTLAAMNGHAFAGGALFAMCHDLRAQRKGQGWFCFNEVFVPRFFSPNNLLIIRKKLGVHYHDAVVMGKRYTAEEAYSKGIVHACVPESLLLAESIHVLKSFMGKSGYERDALARMKKDVYSDVTQQFEIDFASLDSDYAAKAKL